MGTLASIRSDVLSDLVRPDLSAEATRAINEAVRDYSSRRFWFNESRDTTFNTVAYQRWYTSADAANIPNLVKIDGLFITDGTTIYDLTDDRMTNKELESLDDGTASYSRPWTFAYFNRELRLYDVPDQAYAVRIVGMVAPGDMSDDADSNVFTLYAEALIRHSAKRRVLGEVIGDTAAAQVAGELEQIALSQLQNETFMRGDPRTIEPFC